jgi:hypothetical protein
MTVRTIGGHKYLYRSERVNGKAVSVYIGPDSPRLRATASVVSIMMTRLKLCDTALRSLKQSDFDVIRRRFYQRWDDWNQAVTDVFRFVMESSGYHQHQRGAWRFRGMASKPKLETLPAELPATAPAMDWFVPMDVEEMLLGTMLQRCPTDEIRDATYQRMARMRAELASGASGPLELLLVDRVCATWLNLQQIERYYVNRTKPNVGSPGVNIPFAMKREYEHLANRANARFLAACKALAVCRNLEAGTRRLNVKVEAIIQRLRLPSFRDIEVTGR